MFRNIVEDLTLILISTTCSLHILMKNPFVTIAKISFPKSKIQLKFCIHFKNQTSKDTESGL